ncbi:RNA polymerase sigma-70 factor, ECF subfamily [Paenibacillus sophorae]|uniref:RNA polymerase sigma factor n=2 Tax=Paenibacillus sophorae TaxID=1333845 RepID=A0A1H8FSC7_9BACL|nr:RNA polymerase sigma factor [Paenibacillus sophorae]SEN34157.1 RNA polymerase sigma-70 factor, ECF subfamily [Paenibacillus sophorae]
MKHHPIMQRQAQEIFEEHSSYVYGVALMITKSPAMADDVTQETFLRAFAKFHLYDSSRPIRPWLYRIAINITRSMHRKLRWQSLFGQVPERDSGDSLELIILAYERHRELWEAVSSLSKKQREVITLHYYAELPLRETVETLDISLGTCKSRLNAALVKLRNNRHFGSKPLPVREGRQ